MPGNVQISVPRSKTLVKVFPQKAVPAQECASLDLGNVTSKAFKRGVTE